MHSDRLYLRCTFCNQFVLLARTNIGTRQFADWVKLEAFIKEHLKCNPYYAGDNLLGVPGIDVTAWSDCIYNQMRMETAINKLNKAMNDKVKEVMERFEDEEE